MSLISIWYWFVFLMSISETNTSHYLLFCVSMFYLTYLYNQISPFKLTCKFFSILFLIPSVIFCRIIYVYNYLLSFNPLEEHIIVFTIFLYLYILIYICWEAP